MAPSSPHADSDSAPWLQDAEPSGECSTLDGSDHSSAAALSVHDVQNIQSACETS